jgi:competence protein ComEA
MPRVSRPRAVAYLAVVLALLALGGRFLAASLDDEAAPSRTTTGSPLAVVEDPGDTVGDGTATAPAGQRRALLVVHVVGAVRRPGLYRLAEGSRIADAIRTAGGAKASAALALVNLAAPVADGQQIAIPREGSRAPGASGVPQPATAQPGGPASPVNLNAATLEQLDTLPGVGPVTAQRIVEYREANGAFRSVDELDAVPGIGPARLEQLRELVSV